MPPNFIIIGAMKAGTTSLFQYLARHPGAKHSSIKETDFFKSPETFARGRAWYEGLFKSGRGDTSVIGFEASPNYTKRHLFPGVPERMHSVVPDAKLIYVLRDPIQRALSNYVHNYANGRENDTFADAIRKADNSYALTSCYFYQLEAFLDVYPRENILLLEAEKLRADPVETLNSVYEFVGLDPIAATTTVGREYNVSKRKGRRTELGKRIDHHFKNPVVRRGVKLLIPRTFLQKDFEKPTLTDDDQKLLADTIAPDIAKLRAFSGMTFADWSV